MKDNNQSAGKYVGKGIAGCIFRPHLKCQTVSNKKNSIGKVFDDHEEYDNELQMARIIERIDPDFKFSIPILGTCDNLHYYRHNDEVSKCSLIDNKHRPQDYKQIIYKYGGKSLQDTMTSEFRVGSITNFIKIFSMLEPVLEGISKFNSRNPSPNVVHLDIKPHNMLVLRSKLYLIDFGLLSAHDEVYTKHRNHILSSDYPWYPPEFKAYVYPSSGGYDKLISRINDNYAKVEPEVGKAIVNVLKMDPKKDFEGFVNDKVAKKDYIKFADKIDVFSLGIVLLQLLLWSGYHKRKYSRPSKYSVIQPHVISLIKGMIQFDPRQRMTIQQVLQKYRDIIALL
jgi:serine/threonine protein kinase